MKRFPWWGSVIVAIGCYYLFKYGLADLYGTGETADFFKLLAPLVAMGFLLLAAKQLYDTDHDWEEDAEEADADQEDKPADGNPPENR